MCGALGNFIKHTAAPLETVLTMVSEAPARAVGIFDHKGSLDAGKDADVVLLDRELAVRQVLIAGKIEFTKSPDTP